MLVTAFLFVVIIGKVFYIQVIDYKKLNNYATSLWSRNLPLAANRGIIYDTNGVELATNITTTSLVLIPNQIVDKEKVAKIAKKKATEIKDMANELVDYAVEKGTPVLKEAAEKARLKAVEVTKEVLEKLEEK